MAKLVFLGQYHVNPNAILYVARSSEENMQPETLICLVNGEKFVIPSDVQHVVKKINEAAA